MDKATAHDYRKLEVEGCHWQSRYRGTERPRGWYYRDRFIGYNAIEAIKWFLDNGI